MFSKTYAKGTKLGGTGKNKEQRDWVRRAKKTIPFLPIPSPFSFTPPHFSPFILLTPGVPLRSPVFSLACSISTGYETECADNPLLSDGSYLNSKARHMQRFDCQIGVSSQYICILKITGRPLCPEEEEERGGGVKNVRVQANGLVNLGKCADAHAAVHHFITY